MEFPVLLTVEAVAPYRLQLEYNDGVSGCIDLSDLKGKGIFKWWNKGDNFKKVYMDQETHAVKWTDSIEMDADALYLRIRQLSFENWKKVQEGTVPTPIAPLP